MLLRMWLSLQACARAYSLAPATNIVSSSCQASPDASTHSIIILSGLACVEITASRVVVFFLYGKRALRFLTPANGHRPPGFPGLTRCSNTLDDDSAKAGICEHSILRVNPTSRTHFASVANSTSQQRILSARIAHCPYDTDYVKRRLCENGHSWARCSSRSPRADVAFGTKF